MEFKYCISCGKMVVVGNKPNHDYHIIPESTLYWDTYDPNLWHVCNGPFTDSPPPPILSDEQWETVFANEPSGVELEMMNREAETLIQN